MAAPPRVELVLPGEAGRAGRGCWRSQRLLHPVSPHTVPGKVSGPLSGGEGFCLGLMRLSPEVFTVLVFGFHLL